MAQDLDRSVVLFLFSVLFGCDGIIDLFLIRDTKIDIIQWITVNSYSTVSLLQNKDSMLQSLLLLGSYNVDYGGFV